MNPFKPNNGPIDKLKRNVYDLSFTNHFTGNFGTLYPVFCKEVNPGDSMSIETTFGLRAQPMIFPVQTPIRADVHFFLVRNRTLWTNFMDFYGKTKDGIEHPYIDRPVSDFRTKSIYDFLGIPTTVMADSNYLDYFAVNPYNIFNTQFSTGKDIVALQVQQVTNIGNLSDPLKKYKERDILSISSKPLFLSTNAGHGNSLFSCIATSAQIPYIHPCFTGSFIEMDRVININASDTVEMFEHIRGSWTFPNAQVQADVNATTAMTLIIRFAVAKSSQNNLSITTREIKMLSFQIYSGTNSGTHSQQFYLNNGIYTFNATHTYWNGVFYNLNNSIPTSNFDLDYFKTMYEAGFDLLLPIFVFGNSGSEGTLGNSIKTGISNIGGCYSYPSVVSSTVVDSSERNYLPWCGNNKQLKINALPYRAYEAVYNSFYRNSQVNPFKLSPIGQPEYNRYVTNLDDGADDTPYKLYQRNYEYDFLTGAFHSPQQGLAPLIGLTVNNSNQTATFKFSSPDINNGAEITATTRIDDGGQVIGITGYDPELPQSNIERLMEAINYGISINDIRQTNALQRWLEKNIRRGYRYKDQLMSHFGVNVEYNELLMPEFIGGASQELNVDTIYQTVTNENGVLGDYAGRGGVVGSSKHRVSKYCDEAGFIIGILSIVPTPVYSQVPAGYAFKSNLLDYYFPEFSKIGMQPILTKDVTPLQSSPTQLNDVFGYQRPYWDLIRSIDEVHGEFRSTANGYIIQRMFAETPILNQNFIEINSEHLNDVFMITDTDVSDQFKGMIKFDVKKKTTIPLNAIPTIE